MKNFIFPEEVKTIFKVFSNDVDKIRLVGGCVRDFLLNKEINDYDFATSYKPEEVKDILNKNNIKYFTTGEKFGTITSVINDKKFEITSLRRDVKTDGRHTTVEFTDSYRKDAERRDFTFNALYLDFSGKIYDFFGGLDDIKEKKIKFIGDAKKRIVEDNLRILRFFRFYCSCAECFEYNDLKVCAENKKLIKNLSKERITDEFLKILNTKYCIKGLKIMEKYGILEEIFDGNINVDNIEIFYSLADFISFDYSTSNNLFIFVLLLSKNNIKFNFTLSNKEKKYINCLIDSNFMTDFYDNLPENFSLEIKKLLFLFREKNIVKDIIILNFCNKYDNIESFNNLKLCLDILKNVNIPEFNISVEDLILCGFSDKKKFSKIIKKSKQMYVESNFKLNKNQILELIKNNKNKYFYDV